MYVFIHQPFPPPHLALKKSCTRISRSVGEEGDGGEASDEIIVSEKYFEK